MRIIASSQVLALILLFVGGTIQLSAKLMGLSFPAVRNFKYDVGKVPVLVYDGAPERALRTLASCSGCNASRGHDLLCCRFGQRFTGKERDAETANSAMTTGLDYFGARYYGSAMGRWTSPDQINVTNARLFSPSNTLNKYAYAANNPLKFIDPDGNDVTIYYRASRGLFTADFGHVFVGALNQKTGQVRFLDYWAGSGPPGPGVVNRNMTLDRLREHGSITIQTTPEAAQKVIDQIDKIMANPPAYTLRLSHTGPQGLACTILCQNVLREIGINLSGAYLPYDVWDEAYRKYSPLFSNFGQWNPGTYTWGRTSVQYQPGRDFGSPRFSGVDYNWLMWSLYINNNAAAPKACVEVSDSATGTKSKQCE